MELVVLAAAVHLLEEVVLVEVVAQTVPLLLQVPEAPVDLMEVVVVVQVVQHLINQVLQVLELSASSGQVILDLSLLLMSSNDYSTYQRSTI
jgi:hypothetical protein